MRVGKLTVNCDRADFDRKPSAEDVQAPAEVGQAASGEEPTRRSFVRKGGKLLVYSSPLIQLFRPKQALAASPGLSGMT